MSFKVGQEVVCIKTEPWCKVHKVAIPHPKKGDIVTISFICDDGWLQFKEYGIDIEFEYWNFRPLDYQFVEEVIKIAMTSRVQL